MKTNLIFMLLLLFFQSSYIYAQLKFVQYSKEYYIDPTKKSIPFAFDYKNIGSKPITILDVRTSCKCTVTKYSKKTIQKNISGKIEGYIDVEPNKQPAHIKIEIHTDYYAQKSIILNIALKTDEIIEITPKILFWKKNDTKDGKVIILKPLKNLQFIIKKITNFSNKFTFKQINDNSFIYLLPKNN